MATTTLERHTHSAQFSANWDGPWTDFSGYVTNFVTHHDRSAERGTVEIHCYAYPAGLAENDYVLVYIDGKIRFNGRMARPARNHIAGDVVFYCEGRGAYLAKNWRASEIGDLELDEALDAEFNRSYENQEDGEIITNLAEAAGVEVSMHEIESSGYVRGTVVPVLLKPGQSFWSLIRGDQGLDEPVGYCTFEDNRGVIVRIPFNVGSSSFTAEEGVNIISATRTPQGTESIKNRCVYYGFAYEGAEFGGIGIGDYREDNSNIDGDNPQVIRNTLLESDDDCLDAATQYVLHHNFPWDEADVILLGDPDRTVGDSGIIDSVDGLDYVGDSSSLRFVDAIEEHYGSGTGYETHLKMIRPVESW